MDFHKHLLFVNWKLTYKEQLFLRDRLLQSVMTEHHTHTRTHTTSFRKLYHLSMASWVIFYLYCLQNSISLNEVYYSTLHGMAYLYKTSCKSVNLNNCHRQTRTISQEPSSLLHVFLIRSQNSKITNKQRKTQHSTNTFTTFLYNVVLCPTLRIRIQPTLS